MRPIEVIVMTAAWLAFAVAVALALVDRDLFYGLVVVEDGILEWATVVAMGAAAVVSFTRLLKGFGTFGLMKKLALLSIVVLAVFGIGEEISWGQRILGLETPQWFTENNYQNELNVHNLVFGDIRFHKDIFPKALLLFFLLYLGVLTPLYSRYPRIRSLLDGWGVPVPKKYQIVSYFVAILIVEGFLKSVTDSMPRRGELTEFIVSVIVALNIIFPRNQAAYSTEPK